MTYSIYKFAHVLGVIFLIGNVSVTSIWKVFADRTNDCSIVAFAQRLVTHTDWTLTGGGILLTMLGGYGMTWEARMPLTEAPWLFWSQVLFVVSGIIWFFCLIPIQIAQSRQAKAFAALGPIPLLYRKLSRCWILLGIGATIPLVVALYLMIVKVVIWLPR